MDGHEFLNQNPCIQSWPDDFHFSTFFSVAQRNSKCMSPSGPSLSPCNSFSCYLSIWPFCYVLSVPIFYFKIVLLPLHSIVGLSLCILHLPVVSFLLLFSNVLFCLYYLTCSPNLQVFFLSRISLNLSLHIALSGLSAVLFWSFYPNISQCIFPSLAVLLVVTVSLPILVT